ncbi:glucosyltransferase domain-containing protein [Salinicola halimionae]|uniref:glucosyltransferase domain-containing protein n=1 Tax=Salinicola halimionae TaxID=1949081 RepID=UPI000DA1FD8E|nr:glucosyltransferase domain-containing protein [Salinicola halimionae]
MRIESHPDQVIMSAGLHRWLGIMAYLAIFSYPLVHADRLYRDDVWRAFHGEMGWVSNGRPLSSLVVLLVNGGPRLADLAPLPLWLGLAAVTFSILLWRRRLLTFDSNYAWLAMLILVVQPFFLQNLSYHFDALPMALALACAVTGIACALDPRANHAWQAGFRWLTGGAGVLASLFLYQPAANVYFVLLAFHVALTIAQRGRPDWSLHLGALTIGSLALVISKVVSAGLIGGAYSMQHSTLAPLGQLPGHLIEQTWRFWHYAAMTLDKPTWWLVIGLSAVTLVGLMVAACHQRNLAGLAVMIVILLCLPLSGLGFLSALADPIWRPRVMMGFGALYAGLLFCVLAGLGRSRWPLINQTTVGWPLIVAALGMPLTLAYAYGNAQHQQAFLADDVSMKLIDDLATQPKAAPLVIDGALPYSRTTRNAIAVHPMIGELIYPYLDNGYWWGYQNLYRQGLSSAFELDNGRTLRQRFQARCRRLQPLTRRAWYTLYAFEGKYVVSFSPECHRSLTATELPIDD